MAGLAMAAAVASGIASGRGMSMELEARDCSAKVPKGGRALPKRTRVPAGSWPEGGLEDADAVDSGDEGEDAGAAVVGAVGERFDDAVKSGGADGDEDFAGVGVGDGVVEGGVGGRGAEGLDYGSVHGRLRNEIDFNCTGVEAGRNDGPMEVHYVWIDANSESAIQGCACGD